MRFPTSTGRIILIFFVIVAILDYEKLHVYGFIISSEAHAFTRKPTSVVWPASRDDDPLGPPDYLSSLPIDTKSGAPLYRYDNFGAKQNFEVLHLSQEPQIFLLRNYISTLERYTLQWNARNHPKEATIYNQHDDINQSGRSHSNVSWLPPLAANGIPLTLARCSSRLLLSNEMQGCTPGGGLGLCEPMQLVRYDSEGEFILHHDALGRAVTVLSYLNGVGGTWFPLANWDLLANHDGDRIIPQNKPDTLQLIKDLDLQPGRDGLLLTTGHVGNEKEEESADNNNDSIVRVYPGDAVVFYNYNRNKDVIVEDPKDLCDIDWRAIHAALPASEEKFIATLWFKGGSLIQYP